jgi:hypothetical protein
MSSKSDSGHALILTEKRLREELSKNNPEVLLIIAAALNPMMFADKVDFLSPTSAVDDENYVVIRISGTGNAYAIHFTTVAKLALILAAKTGKRSEAMGSIENVCPPVKQAPNYFQ